MKTEFIIIIITACVIYNIYTDGKYSKWYYIWKKELQMAMVGLIGLSLYLVFKRDPAKCKNILLHANNVVKYLPVDKSTMGMISPILDFTSSNKIPFMDEINSSRMNPQHQYNFTPAPQESNGQVRATKRSVSETKKKYVASIQKWKCGECQTQLNAWFEVDHKVRLEHGGGNDVQNLVALCRECHGKKTAMENM